ncbi:hypothetical protein COY26_01995 [Candidatus Woesearchaeota archaeon CG_4_10_14_0_2_um_filter_33_10]|nr:MAG: hypothetical protein AUJ83_01975 [Candidatus Woesearchaeota archaeon CG1_02_33_12]PIN78622.1 MAG: hypothetical protein COV14_02830 [Candidatus Woesearchaeota archaeon CG10_big_fil_rev_8_21_14_0_10_33_12]PIU72358.1 MAG: hypothetical protein COS79_03370 [Candidatus Woesearchaeota archaeon CG06_land_8_20_14_3_00_33_13]PIZ53392.1 MAG: hypothetical protein COY26_01995 [Candidatus Woesearchaeota archaeon CG_4_10_14_0_2_um_filter_33_10]
MASMALNIIGKLILILVVIGVVFGLFQTLFPKAADAFFNKTKLNLPIITIGKDQTESEFEVPPEMKENVELIYNKILELSSEDTEKGEEIKKLELKNFGTCELAVTQNNEEKLSIMVNVGGKIKYYGESLEGQIEYYEKDIKYNLCVIAVEKKWYSKKLKISDKTQDVEKIVFTDENNLKIDEDKNYKFLGLIKRKEDVCFVYQT